MPVSFNGRHSPRVTRRAKARGSGSEVAARVRRNVHEADRAQKAREVEARRADFWRMVEARRAKP